MLEIRLRYHGFAVPIAALLETPAERSEITFVVLESQPIVALSNRNSIFHDPKPRPNLDKAGNVSCCFDLNR